MIAEAPCKNCLCLPTCKHKTLIALMNDCSIIERYLFSTNVTSEEYWKRLRKLFDLLDPETWSLETVK
jgi:hypothetical protein